MDDASTWGFLPRGARAPLLAFAAFGLFAGCWSALLPAVRDNVQATETVMGLCLLASGLGVVPALFIAGPAFDRHGRRVLAIAVVVLAIAAFLTSLATSPLQLAGALVLVGFGGGATDIAMNAAVAEAESGARPLMNLAHALFSIGAAAGGAITGIEREIGWDAPMIVTSLGLALVAVAVINWLPPSAQLGVPAASASGSGDNVAASPSTKPLVTRFLVIVGGLVALSFIVESTAFSWSAIHLEDTFDASPGVAGFTVAAFFAGSVIGRITAHVRGERQAPLPLLVGSGLLITLGAALVAASPTAAPAIAAVFLVGLGTATVAPTLYSIAAAGSPERRGSALATVAMLGYLGNLSGPPIGGFVADAASLRWTFGMLVPVGLLLALGSALALRGQAPVRPDEHVGTTPDNLGPIATELHD